MTPEHLFTVALLGAIIGLDVVSFPQAMMPQLLAAPCSRCVQIQPLKC
jgi:hypothetical protein